MNSARRIAAAALASGVLLASCTSGSGDAADRGAAPSAPSGTGAGPDDSTATAPAPSPGSGAGGEPVFSGELSPAAVLAGNADYSALADDEWSAADAQDIELAGAGGRSTADGVRIDDARITIAAPGVYRLRGSLAGQVVIDAGDDAVVALILDGATISSLAGPAIEARAADDVALWLAPGSRNAVSDAGAYPASAEANAAIYVDADLTISGSGALEVTGRGNDGITSTDDLVILSGDISVTAADDALRGKDALSISGGALTLRAGDGDGLKSDQEDDVRRGYIVVSGGEVTIESGDDGMQAQTDIVMTGGSVRISAADDAVKAEAIVSVAGGALTVSRSTEAIEAASIGIFAGALDLTSSDDGINGAGADADAPAGGGMADTGERIEISGGALTVDAGGDGIDSNGTLTISGGDIVVYGPTSRGNGGIDANGAITMTGGTLLSLSAGGMEPAIAAGGQGWVIVSAQLSAGQRVSLVDGSGAELMAFASRKTANAVTYSGPDVVTGQPYSIVSGGSTLGTATAGAGGDRFPRGPR